IDGDRNSMKRIGIAILAGLLTLGSAQAAGWSSVHKYVKKSGNCAGQEVLASHYSSGKRTASGERFDPNGNTAAARTWPIGTVLTITNPKNGRSITVRINDTGPWGIAYRICARRRTAAGNDGNAVRLRGVRDPVRRRRDCRRSAPGYLRRVLHDCPALRR